MKSIVLFCIALCAAQAMPAAAPAAELTVVNSGFEEVPAQKDAPPPGWKFLQHAGEKAYEKALDTKVRYKGHNSFRIERLRPQVFGMVSQLVPIGELAGRTVELTAAMRTKQVGPRGWVLTMTLVGETNPRVRSEPMKGTTDFTQVKLTATIPPHTQSIEIAAILRDAGTGWLDDVHLRVVDETGPSPPSKQKARN